METFAEYILNEQDLASKIEIAYDLSKKRKIFFDKSIVFRVEIARLFINSMKIDVDKNEVLTACLLCNCKKINNAQDIEKIQSYAKEGAKYLKEIGFSNRFCKICEEINRYSGSNPREKESDVLELVDQFGGMLLDRPERIGFKPDEAMVLLEYRNLKDVYNRFLHTFNEFVEMMEQIELKDSVDIKALRKLVKIYNETPDLIQFIKKVCYEYEPEVDKAIARHLKNIESEMFETSNRPLFSEETAKKILSHMDEKSLSEGKVNV